MVQKIILDTCTVLNNQMSLVRIRRNMCYQFYSSFITDTLIYIFKLHFVCTLFDIVSCLNAFLTYCTKSRPQFKLIQVTLQIHDLICKHLCKVSVQFLFCEFETVRTNREFDFVIVKQFQTCTAFQRLRCMKKKQEKIVQFRVWEKAYDKM